MALRTVYDTVAGLPSLEKPAVSEAIFTGSAVVVDGAGPKKAPGIVQIYPGP